MPNKEDYDQIYGRSPIGNWFDNPPIVCGGMPLPPAPLPERMPLPEPYLSYSPPWEVPLSPPVPGVIDPVAPMYRPPWETGPERGR